MEKARDRAPIHEKDLEVQYANLLSKSKLMESDFKKEVLQLKILYQSEREKSSSLETSMKSYPLKITALEDRLKEEIALRKNLESSLEECSSQLKRTDPKELERYQQACAQLQSENLSLNQHYLNTLNDKNELQKNLTKYIDFLNKKIEKMRDEHERALEDIKFEEEQRRLRENKELREEITYLHSQVTSKKEKCSRMSQKYEDSKDFQLKIAREADKKESIIRILQQQNERLLGKSCSLDSEFNFDEVDSICGKLEILRTENIQLKNKIQAKKDKFDKKKEKLAKEMNLMACEIKDLGKNKGKIEQDAAALRSKIVDQAQNILDLQNKLKDCEEEQSQIKRQAEKSIEPVIKKLRTERDSFKVQLEEVRKSIDMSSFASTGPSLFDELSDLNNQTPESLQIELNRVCEEKDKLENELSRIIEERNNLEKERKSLDWELSYKKTTVSALESEIKELKDRQVTEQKLNAQEVSEKEELISALQRRKKELKGDIKSLTAKLNEKDEAIRQLERERTEFQLEIKQLQAIEAELKQKETYISEIQSKNEDLQNEIELLQKISSKMVSKNLKIAAVPDAETDIRTSIFSTKISEESFSSRNSEGSESNSERLHSEILEKESLISDLNREKQELSNQISTLRKENTDLSCQINLQVIHPRYTGKKGIAAILELESERDMLKSEILRLETQLQLSTQEWTVYSNQLYQELVKEHDQKLVLIEKNNLNKSHKSMKHSVGGKSTLSKRNSYVPIPR